jgi:nitroreductase
MTLGDVLSRRYSCRAFRPDPVPRGTIDHILEAARLAPSACNRQPWRFSVVTDAALRAQIVREGFLPGIRMPWAADAPVLIVLGIEKSVMTHVAAPWLSRVDYAWVDAGIAGEHAVLAATALGLGSCWIGWIRSRVVRRLVGWPAGVRPAAVIAMGYASDAGECDEREPVRKSLEDFVTWHVGTRGSAGESEGEAG